MAVPFSRATPQNLAAIRNAIVSMFRLEGSKNIAETLRNCAWQTVRLFARLGILNE